MTEIQLRTTQELVESFMCEHPDECGERRLCDVCEFKKIDWPLILAALQSATAENERSREDIERLRDALKVVGRFRESEKNWYPQHAAIVAAALSRPQEP